MTTRLPARAGGLLALLGAVLAMSVLASACSNSDTADSIDSGDLQDALRSSGGGIDAVPGSTPGAQIGGAGDPKSVVGASPAEIQAKFGAAIDAGDFCRFVAELDDVVTDLADPAAVIAAYAQLRDAVARATPIVHGSLADSWAQLVSATERAAEAAERADGDATDKSLEGVFADVDVDRSIDEIFSWYDLNCPTSPTTVAPPSPSS